MRHVTEAGLDLIKRFEGFSPTIYMCPAGHPTIGYGHVVLAHEQKQFAAGITKAEATELLRKDVGIAERAVLRLISVPLTDGQFVRWSLSRSTWVPERYSARPCGGRRTEANAKVSPLSL